MAKFLTTAGSTLEIETLLRTAKQELVLISPYLQLSSILSERLKEVNDRGVKIIVVHGKTDLSSKVQEVLVGLSNLSLYYLDNLHAKCYYNETRMVITSMNLYAFSEKNNREMGILIEAAVNKELYEEARDECLSIIKAAQPKPIQVEPQTSPAKPPSEVVEPPLPATKSQDHEVERSVTEAPNHQKGFCIRCGVEVPMNPEKPYCKSCFTVWSEYENPAYEEKYCHSCKKENKSSMTKPVCYSCYKQSHGHSKQKQKKEKA